MTACTLPTNSDGTAPCGRTLLGKPEAPFCPVHDRVRCTAAVHGRDADGHATVKACGYRLHTGHEERCPQCGASTKLQDVLRGQK